MLELLKEEMHCLAYLCKEQANVCLCSCIEGKMGRAWVDNKENPTIAIVVVSDFCYLLGCITSNNNELTIDEMLEICKWKIIVAYDNSWVSILESFYFNKLKRFSRYSIS